MPASASSTHGQRCLGGRPVGAHERQYGLGRGMVRQSRRPLPGELRARAPGSWGRPIAIVKARLLAGDWDLAERDARWTLEQGAAEADSPIGRYAATLALLVLGRDEEARVLADVLRTRDDFPAAVGDALAFIAAEDPARLRRSGRGGARIVRDARGLPRGSSRRGHGDRAAERSQPAATWPPSSARRCLPG